MAVNMLALYAFQDSTPQIRALTMLGWILPLRSFRQVMQDLSGQNVMDRWEYITLFAGGFITVALATYNYPFAYFTLPFALGLALVGFSLLRKTYLRTADYLVSPLHWGLYSVMAFYFITRLAFPFWRADGNFLFNGHAVELLIVVCFAGTTLATMMEFFAQKQEHVMKGTLDERSEKMMGQSKYSELGMMSAGIAHEINNPLAVIQARTTQLLRIYRDPSKQQEMADGLQQILYTSERINRTIQGVREFAHQDDKTPAKEIALKDLVDDVLAFCGQRLKNHGVNLRFYGLENHSVMGNKIQLEQIILNLINNSFDAVEFLPDKWIEMSVEDDEHGNIQILFKDSGHGIPPEIASKMMEPFYSTKDLGKGTGLGLALARGIAEKHGGFLKYIPDAPHTTFLLQLPRPSFISRETDWGLPVHH